MKTWDIHPFFSQFAGEFDCSGRAEGATADAGRAPSAATFLGIDQDATRIGWARGFLELGPKANVPPTMGTETLPDWTGPDGVYAPGPPLMAVWNFIFQQVMLEGVTHVFCERPWSQEPHFVGQKINRDMEHKLVRVLGVVELACEACKVYCRAVTPNEWRSQFILSRAPKEITKGEERSNWYKSRAIERCNSRGWEPSDHHQADAAGILNYGLCEFYPNYADAWLPNLLSRGAKT